MENRNKSLYTLLLGGVFLYALWKLININNGVAVVERASPKAENENFSSCGIPQKTSIVPTFISQKQAKKYDKYLAKPEFKNGSQGQGEGQDQDQKSVLDREYEPVGHNFYLRQNRYLDKGRSMCRCGPDCQCKGLCKCGPNSNCGPKCRWYVDHDGCSNGRCMGGTCAPNIDWDVKKEPGANGVCGDTLWHFMEPRMILQDNSMRCGEFSKGKTYNSPSGVMDGSASYHLGTLDNLTMPNDMVYNDLSIPFMGASHMSQNTGIVPVPQGCAMERAQEGYSCGCSAKK